MTYSLVARDTGTDEVGVLLQSYYYGCGPRTLHAVPGVGIVVMQMVPEERYAVTGESLLLGGSSPSAILDELVAADLGAAMRQVVIMNANGDVAAYTGQGCIPHSGHVVRNGLSAQGAMVESEAVWLAAADSFENSPGSLPERLIAGMRAGEREGGDIRGRRAAAMLIVSGQAHDSWVRARPINIRVDDHVDPLAEVERQLAMQRHMNAIELAFERGLSGDVGGAIADYAAIARQTPDDPDVTMRYAIVLAMQGRISDAREQLQQMSRIHDGWAKVPKRLTQVGLLPEIPELI